MTESSDDFRIPHDEEYVTALGRAVYGFAYYEWGVIYLIQRIEPGFVRRHIDSNPPMTSGAVATHLRAAWDKYAKRTGHDESVALRIQQCVLSFDELRGERNRLIHAHPITDHDGSQILHYQSFRAAHGQRWPLVEIEYFAHAVSLASLAVGHVYYDESW